MEVAVVADPDQGEEEIACPLIVMVVMPWSYTVVFTGLVPPASAPDTGDTQKEGLEKQGRLEHVALDHVADVEKE